MNKAALTTRELRDIISYSLSLRANERKAVMRLRAIPVASFERLHPARGSKRPVSTISGSRQFD